MAGIKLHIRLIDSSTRIFRMQSVSCLLMQCSCNARRLPEGISIELPRFDEESGFFKKKRSSNVIAMESVNPVSSWRNYNDDVSIRRGLATNNEF